jgi:hypothetical protein
MYQIVVLVLSCSVVIAFSLLWSVFIAVSHEIRQSWEERIYDLETQLGRERKQYNCERTLLREYLLEANCMLTLATKTPLSG